MWNISPTEKGCHFSIEFEIDNYCLEGSFVKIACDMQQSANVKHMADIFWGLVLKKNNRVLFSTTCPALNCIKTIFVFMQFNTIFVFMQINAIFLYVFYKV